MIGSHERAVQALQPSLSDPDGLSLSNLAADTFCGFL